MLGRSKLFLIEARCQTTGEPRKKQTALGGATWRSLNPTLKASFAVFEANKLKRATQQQHVAKYKQVAEGIVEAAREGNTDPVEAGVKAHKQAEQEIEEAKPMSKEERQQIRINEWFNSDWSEEIAAQEAQMQAERDAVERARRGGFWCG